MENNLPILWVLSCAGLAMVAGFAGAPGWLVCLLLIAAGVPFALTLQDFL